MLLQYYTNTKIQYQKIDLDVWWIKSRVAGSIITTFRSLEFT